VRYDIILMQLTTKLTQREGEGAVNGSGAASNATTTSVPQAHVNTGVLDEDIDLVAAVQRGIKTHGYHPGPLAAKEGAVGWFADRIRADLGEVGA
jgi:hypothetical protein